MVLAIVSIVVVQSLSWVLLFVTPWVAARQASLSLTIPEFVQVHVHWIGDAIQPSHPLVPSFFFCLHSFPASGSFPMSWLFPSGGQSTEASVSASVLPMSIQGWYCSIITFSEFIYLITGSLYLLTIFTHFVHPSTAPLTLITINLFSELLFICF